MSGILEEAACTGTAVADGAAEAEVLPETTELNFRGGQVVVPTTLNAISVDYRHWRDQGVDPAVGEPASQPGGAYVEMGAEPTFTCAPYLLDAPPTEGEQIAWAESNTVVHANSILGARTLKYPDYVDIRIALYGRADLRPPDLFTR